MITKNRILFLMPFLLAVAAVIPALSQDGDHKVYAQHAVTIPDFVVNVSTVGQLEYGDSDFQALGRFPNVESTPIAVGQKAKVQIDELGNTWLNGQVTVADWTPSKTGHTSAANVTVTLSNIPGELQGALKPKMGCTIVVTIAHRQNVLAVPEPALVSHKQGDAVDWGVLVIEDSRAHFKPVIAGMSSDGFIEITKGLSATDTFIVGRPNAASLPPLVDGDRVVIVEKPKANQGDALERTTY
ncbi:MAG TPA: hypothetical protein VFC63_04830 [Blastocatellia bacterium]|nr:hypothetical protein [Blastocatellia bacterium]